MVVNQKQLSKINTIQVGILKEVIRVCDILGIDYYMVHGSLLGTVMSGTFMPFDDDIDIAIHRKDYEKFIKKAPDIIDTRYFVQANKTDKDYPLTFSKVRDCNTTYITEVMRNFNINHGIYIDIFPIDYCIENRIKAQITKIKLKILSIRIGCRYKVENISFSYKIKRICSILLYPSWRNAVKTQEKIVSSQSVKSDRIKLTGGKVKENSIPAEWFAEFDMLPFEGIDVKIPKMHHEYLTTIYGDYKNCFLADGKMKSEDTVIINASMVDTEKPYTNYIRF